MQRDGSSRPRGDPWGQCGSALWYGSVPRLDDCELPHWRGCAVCANCMALCGASGTVGGLYVGGVAPCVACACFGHCCCGCGCGCCVAVAAGCVVGFCPGLGSCVSPSGVGVLALAALAARTPCRCLFRRSAKLGCSCSFLARFSWCLRYCSFTLGCVSQSLGCSGLGGDINSLAAQLFLFVARPYVS